MKYAFLVFGIIVLSYFIGAFIQIDWWWFIPLNNGDRAVITVFVLGIAALLSFVLYDT